MGRRVTLWHQDNEAAALGFCLMAKKKQRASSHLFGWLEAAGHDEVK